MLSQTSKEFRILFLLRFTEELIKNSKDIELIRLEEILIKRDELSQIGNKKILPKIDIKQEVLHKLHEKPFAKNKDLKFDPFFPSPTVQEQSFTTPKKFNQRKLSVPSRRAPTFEQPLPPTVSHIKPVAGRKAMIDLGKLNSLVEDRNVKTMETEGENEKVFVSGTMGRKQTGVSLTRDEINQIIDNFAKEAKIPKNEGMFKVAVGHLILTAMISESVGSRFIIKKLEDNIPKSPYRA